MDIYDYASSIETKQEFDKFLEMLYEDFIRNRDKWENNTLERFLEALSTISRDYQNVLNGDNLIVSADKPTWKMFANILLGAIVYE